MVGHKNNFYEKIVFVIFDKKRNKYRGHSGFLISFFLEKIHFNLFNYN
jgi:hypothetical protein